MSRISHAAKRSAKDFPRNFPVSPTLASSVGCQGLAFILRAGANLPSLSQLREHIAEIRRSAIDWGEEQRVLVVVIFAGPPAAYGLHFPVALPLRAVTPGCLSSHETGSEDQMFSAGVVRMVHIWWAGKSHRIALNMMERVSLGTIWEIPPVIIHRSASAQQHSAQHKDAAEQENHSDTLIPGNTVLRRSLLSPEQGGHPFADIRDTLRQRPSLASLLRLTLPSLGQVGAFAKVSLYGLAAIGLVATLFSGGTILPFVLAFVAGRLLFGSAGADKGATARPAPPRGPGLLDQMLGWMRWNNPFGSSLRRQLDARVRHVDNLIARGLIDDALRLALRLGNENRQKRLPHRYPNQLPQARAKLDFDVLDPGYVTPLLADGTNWQLRQSYHQLAQRLERASDFRRAAFIHSQLLENHAEAALLLEKGGMINDAAQLALSAKLDPVLTIRLLYAAGKLGIALAMARRTGCFDALARDSYGKNADFHAHVIKAWTDTLLETGQPLRAIQVTDALVCEGDANPVLQDLRRRWLSDAMQANENAGFLAELVARGLLVGDAVDPAAISAFPHAAVPNGDPLFASAFAALQEQARNVDGAENLLALLDMLPRLAAPKSLEQAPFWTGAGPALIEALARALLSTASDQLTTTDLGSIRRLLRMADASVLAADIGKLAKLHTSASVPAREWHVPTPIAIRPCALAGCLLGNGVVLAWRTGDTLDMFDRHGTPLWSQRLSDVTALVPVGTGTNVLVIQRERDGRSRITRFCASDRSFHPIGVLDLVAHHDVTSESAWLVQVGGDFGALDLARLCAPQPGFEFLWSCALTQRLQAVAFLQSETAASWITIDTAADRNGLVELWHLESSGKLTTSLCMIHALGESSAAIPPKQWAFGQQKFQAIYPPPAMMISCIWSEDQESNARQQRRERAVFEGFDSFISCDFGRFLVRFQHDALPPDAIAETTIARMGSNKPEFVLRHTAQTEITCLARTATILGNANRQRTGGKLLLADTFGRLFVVDPDLLRVTMI